MFRTVVRSLLRAGARPSMAVAAKTGAASAAFAPRLIPAAATIMGLRAAAASSRGMATITYSPPAVKIGQQAPDFTAGAIVDGEIKKLSLLEYAPGSWKVLLFYPKDFTFVCPTELIAFSDAAKKFEAVNAKVIGISTDTEESHLAWIRTPRKKGGLGHMQIPLVADVTKAISADYGVLIEDIGIALRGLFIIDPKGVVHQITVNNLPVGRDVDETIRLIQAYQFVAEHGEVCPAGWKPGAKTMIADPEGSLEYFATVDEADDDLAPGPKMIAIKDAKHFAEVIKSKPKVVADFVAPWCGKCKQIMPFVNQLSEEYSDVTFLKIDTTLDAVADLLPANGVSALPHFALFKNGQSFGKPVIGYKKTPLKDAVASLSKS